MMSDPDEHYNDALANENLDFDDEDFPDPEDYIQGLDDE
jgi:hypothetical protein